MVIDNIDFKIVRMENGDPLVTENGNIYVQRKNGMYKAFLSRSINI